MRLPGEHLEFFYSGALIRRVYDGDTITVDLDQGFGDKKQEVALRLFGINAPELRGQQKMEGKVARDWLRNKLCVPDTEYSRWGWVTSDHKNYVNIQTIKLPREHTLGPNYGRCEKKGKYGRYLAVLWDSDGLNINRQMVVAGMALMVDY